MASVEPICHIVTPVSNLGYGFDNIGVNTLLRQLTANATPTAIILNSQFDDVGSDVQAEETANVIAGHRASCLRDLRRLLRCVGTHGVLLILNAVSTNAAENHLTVVAGIVEEAQTQKYSIPHAMALSTYSSADPVAARSISGWQSWMTMSHCSKVTARSAPLSRDCSRKPKQNPAFKSF